MMATRRIVEKRGVKHYLYEVTPFWDSEKKQGRNRKVYIGPCDADGNLQDERKRPDKETLIIDTPYRSVTLGPYHLLYELSKEMGIEKRLSDAFDTDVSKRIMTLAILRITDRDSLRTIRDTLDTSALEILSDSEWSYSSQRLSELLYDIGNDSSKRFLFYESCLQEDDVAIFDTSVLQSSSKLMDMLENGRMTHRTGLPQVNLGLVHSLRTKLPVMMRLFPGSISDTVTIKGLFATLRSMGSKRITMIMDRGFYSENNMVFMAGKEGIDFLLPLKSGTNLYKEWISQSKDGLDNPVNMFHFHGRTEQCADMTVDWPYQETYDHEGNRVTKLRVLVFNNTEREVEERNSFIARVEDAERLASETEWKDVQHAIANIFTGKLEGMETLFDISEGDDGKVTLERKRNAMTFAMRNFGRIVLLTSLKDPPKDILELYRQRDEDEKDFEDLKDAMDGGIQYVHSKEAAEGILFVQFVALSIRKYMRQRMNKEMRALDIPQILKRLRSMTATQLRSGWHINEIPKKCRDIYGAFGIQLPESFKPSTK